MPSLTNVVRLTAVVALAFAGGLFAPSSKFTRAKEFPVTETQSRGAPCLSRTIDSDIEMRVKTPSPTGKACEWTFLGYSSSTLERKWIDNAAAWGANVCTYVAQEKHLFDSWVPQVLAYEQAAVDKLPEFSELFSRFAFKNTCSGASRSVPIEPFAGTGRHPDTCGGSKDYLLIERSPPPHRRAFFFDLGASLWTSGAGGPSQSWFYETYKKRNVNFDGIYAWEVSVHNPKEVFAQIPGSVRASYHWFNIPADPSPGSADNPFTILLQTALPEDMVVIKIDIDNSPIELKFIDLILKNQNISSRIDELFFEHHFNMQPMVGLGWGSSGSESGMTMVDSAKIFLGLRRLGIRAHVWV